MPSINSKMEVVMEVDKQLSTEAVKSVLQICSDYLMLHNKLPHILMGLKQPLIMLIDWGWGSGIQ